jgi:hypothetical protein
LLLGSFILIFLSLDFNYLIIAIVSIDSISVLSGSEFRFFFFSKHVIARESMLHEFHLVDIVIGLLFINFLVNLDFN